MVISLAGNVHDASIGPMPSPPSNHETSLILCGILCRIELQHRRGKFRAEVVPWHCLEASFRDHEIIVQSCLALARLFKACSIIAMMCLLQSTWKSTVPTVPCLTSRSTSDTSILIMPPVANAYHLRSAGVFGFCCSRCFIAFSSPCSRSTCCWCCGWDG